MAEKPSPKESRPSRWLRAVKIAAPLSLLFPSVLVFLGSLSPVGFLLTVPYVWYCWWLLSNLHRKTGAGAAIGTGLATLLFMLGAAALATEDFEADDPWKLFLPGLLILILIPAILIVAAVGSYATMSREPGDVWALITGLGLGVGSFFLVLLSVSVWLPGLLRSRLAANQAAAVGSIIRINTCAANYQSRFPERGFPPSLDIIGPATEKCLEEKLASGKKSGYKFTYSPGSPNAKGRILSYTLVARPTKYGTTATNSYFTDSSQLIRMTEQDRAATAQDPLIAQ